MSSLGIFNGPKKRMRPRAMHGLGAAPGAYWKDARVQAMQGQLNAQLAAAGCTTVLKTDGLIGAGTCGALAWSKSNGTPPAAYTAAAKDMDAGCATIKTSTAPSCAGAMFAAPVQTISAPTPAAPAAPDIITHGPIIHEPTHKAPAAPAPAADLTPVYVPSPIAPASSSTGMSMGLKIGIGAAAVALVGLAVFAKSKSTSKKAA